MVALFPAQTVGLLTVTLGAVIKDKEPLAATLEHAGVVLVLTVTV
jgi:hypothetical protein